MENVKEPASKRQNVLRWFLVAVLMAPLFLVGLLIYHNSQEQNGLPLDAGQVEYLYQRFFDALPSDVPVIRDALAPYRKDLLEKLWQVLEQSGKKEQRLRAASALAAFDPNSKRWQKVQSQLAGDMVGGPAVYLQTWLESLRPVRGQLLAPLAIIFRDVKRRDMERSLATEILADYAADQPPFLADLLMDADENQFKVLGPKLAFHPKSGLPLLTGELNSQEVAPRVPILQVNKTKTQDESVGTPPLSEDILPPQGEVSGVKNKDQLAQRQANAAVALLMMKQEAKVWPLLEHTFDPSVRSYLIHRLAPFGADAGVIVKRLAEEPDVSIRRALVLSLGEYGEETWQPGERDLLLDKIREVYRTADDPGLHAAAEWLLRRWQQAEWLRQSDKPARASSGKSKTPWYRTSQGQTMVVISGPVEFLMGSPPTEQGRGDAESQHHKRIGRSFALAAKPVTLEEYKRFNLHYDYLKKYVPEMDCPVHGTDWYMAAGYCNWLSEQEGIPKDQWCYEMSSLGLVTKLKKNYLSLTGYRLPTEAEWEYACRAGAVTARYFGEAEDLLGNYGWSSRNAGDRTWPVGSKKPNDWGFFDMEGNVLNWCQESYRDYPRGEEGKVFDDKEDDLNVNHQESRVLRGGAFIDQPRNLRSAARYRAVPSDRGSNVGFRPARTVPY